MSDCVFLDVDENGGLECVYDMRFAASLDKCMCNSGMCEEYRRRNGEDRETDQDYYQEAQGEVVQCVGYDYGVGGALEDD